MGTQDKAEKAAEKLNNQKYLLLTTVLFTLATLVVGALVFRYYMADLGKTQGVTEYDK